MIKKGRLTERLPSMQPVEIGAKQPQTKSGRLYGALVEQFYRREIIGIAAALAIAAILVYALKDQIPTLNLSIWFGVTAIATLLRAPFLRVYVSANEPEYISLHWNRIFLASSFFYGLVWGSAGLFLFPNASFTHQSLVAFVLGGMVAAAAVVLSIVMPVFVAFIIPALVPVGIRFFWAGSELQLAMGLMTTIYGGLMYFVARHISRSNQGYLRATREVQKYNRQLREEIGEHEKTARSLKDARDRLERRVAERTEQLFLANRKLKQDLDERKRMEAEKIGLQVQLQQAQKLEAIGTLAGGIAHDFNNILSAIVGNIELALDDCVGNEEVEESLAEALTAAFRARTLIRQILTFARKTERAFEPISVKEMAQEVGLLIRASLPATIEIRTNLESDALVMADSSLMHRVIMNLGTNAGQVMQDDGGVLSIGLSEEKVDGLKGEAGANTFVKLSVSDTGPGILPELLERIFDPYFTTKNTGEGTGMGLSVVQGIVQSFGGRITVKNRRKGGARFDIYLPALDDIERSSAPVVDDMPTGTEHILFVDDEPTIMKAGQRIIERLGYSVSPFQSSVEALAAFKENPVKFDLVVTDYTMPELTGEKLAVEIMELRPDIPVILCTGYSRRIDAQTARKLGIDGFVFKPISKKEMAIAIRKALDDRAAARRAANPVFGRQTLAI
jgi:signal transduction histidine kinase/ActR/RegA family two-component response regulator